MPDVALSTETRAYLDLTRAAERVHRRFLDVLRAELSRDGIRDLNTVQALLLTNIGDQTLTMRELVDQGHYQASNVSYHIRKLEDLGYLETARSTYDRRTVTFLLTKKGLDVLARIGEIELSLLRKLPDRRIEPERLADAVSTLRSVEQAWSDYLTDR